MEHTRITIKWDINWIPFPLLFSFVFVLHNTFYPFKKNLISAPPNLKKKINKNKGVNYRKYDNPLDYKISNNPR